MLKEANRGRRRREGDASRGGGGVPAKARSTPKHTLRHSLDSLSRDFSQLVFLASFSYFGSRPRRYQVHVSNKTLTFPLTPSALRLGCCPPVNVSLFFKANC